MTEYKVVFIIAVKCYRNYASYVQHYVDNIQKFYPSGFCILVDNNSKHVCDLQDKLNNYQNIIILSNNIQCKFEIGAYNCGIKYILDNNMLTSYNYFVFTQDTFILKNKFDFDILAKNNVVACPINDYGSVSHGQCEQYWCNETTNIIKKLNDGAQKNITPYDLIFCWCCSFVLHQTQIIQYYNITRDIVITCRTDSCKSERWLSAILYKLNGYVNFTIDGNAETPQHLGYDFWKVNLFDDIPNKFFVKNVQQKTENTPDI